MRSCCACRSLAIAACLLMRSNRTMRLMPATMRYIAATLAASALVARVEAQTGAHSKAHGGVSGGCRRYPGHVDPKRREDHGNGAKSRVVGKKDVVVESAADGDVGCNQRNVHGAEANHPAPRHRPVRQEPIVDTPLSVASITFKRAYSMSSGYQRPGR